MAKRSQRRGLCYEKDQAGCMWGFISIFDFRRGQSPRKLLADRRRASRQVGAASSPKLIIPDNTEKSMKVEGEEEREVATREVKTRVKELMEEDMSSKNQNNGTELEPELSDSFKALKKTCETCKRRRNLSLSDLDDFRGPGASRYKVCNSDDLQCSMEELGLDHVKSREGNLHSDTVLEEKLSSAIEVFINHKLKNGQPLREDEISENTIELTDALETLRSNKELFHRLLQDPNSKLVKHIESLEDGIWSNHILKCNFSENNPIHAKADEIIEHEQPHFSRRRSKSQGSYPLMEDASSQTSSKIVILKPGPVHFPGAHTVNNKVQQSERNSSYFSFTEIKRKLKHVMGKDREGISSEGIVQRMTPMRSSNEKGSTGDNAGWSSPNRNHFYTERFAKPSTSLKRRDHGEKAKDVQEAMVDATRDYPKKRVPNIYVEAKKHIFEMLETGAEKEGLMSVHLHKSLGRILSLPDYYTSSSCSSSNSDSSDDQILSSQMRVAPPDTSVMANKNTHQPIQEEQEIHRSNVETLSCVDSLLEANLPSLGDTEETSQSRSQEDDRVSNASIDLTSSSITVNVDSSYVTVSFFEESSELASECLKTESQGAEQMASSPPAHSFDTSKADRTERPSPVSVLEPLCMEDDFSPSSTSCRSGEPEIQPRKIHFEEPAYSTTNQQLCTRTCLESEETAFEYVEAVLLGSDLNWDDFLLRWLSSDQILDPSLFDEVELFSSRSCHDQKLLFDCTNEVLKEVIDRYFGCFSCTRIVKQNIRPIPRGMDLIHEVWNGVEWYLLKHPQPRSLDHLVRKQLARSASWMDLHFDIGNVGIGIEAAILEELLEETIFSLADYTAKDGIISLGENETDISCD